MAATFVAIKKARLTILLKENAFDGNNIFAFPVVSLTLPQDHNKLNTHPF